MEVAMSSLVALLVLAQTLTPQTPEEQRECQFEMATRRPGELARCLSDYRGVQAELMALDADERRACSHALHAKLMSLGVVRRNNLSGPQASEIIDQANGTVHACVATRRRDTEARKAKEAAELKEKLDREKAEAEAEALVERRRADPVWMVPALSAVICRAGLVRAHEMKQIAEEKRLARVTGGGVVDQRKIYELQQQIKKMDDIVAGAKDELRGLKAKPLSCADSKVKPISACMDSDEGCKGDASEYLELVGSPQPIETD